MTEKNYEKSFTLGGCWNFGGFVLLVLTETERSIVVRMLCHIVEPRILIRTETQLFYRLPNSGLIYFSFNLSNTVDRKPDLRVPCTGRPLDQNEAERLFNVWCHDFREQWTEPVQLIATASTFQDKLPLANPPLVREELAKVHGYTQAVMEQIKSKGFPVDVLLERLAGLRRDLRRTGVYEQQKLLSELLVTGPEL